MSAGAPPPAAGKRRSSEATLLALGLCVAGALWLRAGALGAPFFADDFLFLDQARGRSLPETLAAPDPIGNYFRPVSRQVWFWGLGRITGESAAAFHAANFVVFALVLLLLYRIAHRLLPARAAIVAPALLAVHHAADVPLLWASGSQDLLAVAATLLALDWFVAGRRWWAALALGFGLLSKETVVMAPVVGALLARRRGEPLPSALLRALPLFAALAAWLGLWAFTSARRPAMGLEVHVVWSSLPAALAHALHTAFGLEWPHGSLLPALAVPPLPLALALAAVAAASWRRLGSDVPTVAAHSARRHALVAGFWWALLGALPVAAVAEIWSAYYYLFALCGLGLLLAACTVWLPAWAAVLGVLVVGATSEGARRMQEFATVRGTWTMRSHLNQHYLRRGMALSMRCLADLRRARPTLPPRSTLFFAGVPASIAFQSADGPLLRWAYGDTTLRSYFLTRFQLDRALRGPVYFFQVQNDTLTEIAGADSLQRIAFSLLLGEAPDAARDVLALAWRSGPRREETAYRLAWTEAALGHLEATQAWLRAAGYRPGTGPSPQIEPALAQVAAGDTLGAIERMRRAVRVDGMDPGGHALLADLLLSSGRLSPGTIEAYAARVLAPAEPSAWKRWGMVCAAQGRDEHAILAFERYQESSPEALADPEVENALRVLRRRVPGGDLAVEALKAVKTGRR